MGHKKASGIISVTSLVISIAIISTCYSPWGNICLPVLNQNIAMFLILLPFSLFLVSLVLFFLREEVFNSWKKFAMVYIPISAILLFFVAGESSGGGIGFAAIDGEIITWFLSGLFFFISIIILAVKSWKLRKDNKLNHL